MRHWLLTSSMYRTEGGESLPKSGNKHKTSFILKDFMFTSFKNLTLCFYRYNFSDVRVLEGVNIKSLSTNDVLCFHFLEGSRPLLRYIGWYVVNAKTEDGLALRRLFGYSPDCQERGFHLERW